MCDINSPVSLSLLLFLFATHVVWALSGVYFGYHYGRKRLVKEIIEEVNKTLSPVKV